jgi:hypothetical protein
MIVEYQSLRDEVIVRGDAVKSGCGRVDGLGHS